MIICVSPPPLFNQQMPSDGRGKDAEVFVDNAPAERGKVFINDIPPPDITINDITITTRNSNGKHAILGAFYLILVVRASVVNT